MLGEVGSFLLSIGSHQESSEGVSRAEPGAVFFATLGVAGSWERPMKHHIVARFQDGTVLKGTSSDFVPTRDRFHLRPIDQAGVAAVDVDDLKGVFFVNSFEGNPDDRGRADVDRFGLGKKIKVDFKDGETMIGYTSGYSPDRRAFFVFPADPKCNNDRVFVVTAATSDVAFV